MSVTERCTALLVTAIIVGVTFTATVEGQAQCGNFSLTASAYRQNFTSPGYPGVYENFMDCQWSITANSPSRVVVLNVWDIELEGDPYDFVKVYDGPSTSSPLIKSLRAQDVNTQITSTGLFMTVVFHSDQSNTYRGFQLEYLSQEKSAQCGNFSLTATASGQNFTSPGYPGVYESNLDCQWSITTNSPSRVVLLNVLDFELEGTSAACVYDYVNVYDGPSTSSRKIQSLCGQDEDTQITSTGLFMTVVFHSDQSNNFKGFQLEYLSQEKSVECGNFSSFLATTSGQYVTSPGYPSLYQSNMDCQWIITANSPSRVVVLNVLDFELEGSPPPCNYDYVNVYDGPSTSFRRIQSLCGQDEDTQITSTGLFMTVVFHSDQSNNFKGFQFEYLSQEKSALCENASLTANEIVKYITSPGYPNNYPSNMDCQWTISADSPSRVIVLKLFDFEIDGPSPSCTYDYVAFYDGLGTSSPKIQSLCGQVTDTQFASTGPFMTVVFRSDSAVTFRGFKLEYTSVEKSTNASAPCTNATLSASVVTNYITSPGYPNNYPSESSCQWSIQAASSSDVVVLNVLDFLLEGSSPSCNYDYVTIYDGPSTSSPTIQLLCGQVSSVQFTSGSQYVTVVFRSDGSNNFKGFRLEYTSQSGLCANTNLTATGGVKYFNSPGYPFTYPSNKDCQWSIAANSVSRVVVLKFLDFYIQGHQPSCTFDYLEIFDGSGPSSPKLQFLCGQLSKAQFTSTGPFMTVVFHSDASIGFRGFKLEYTSQELSAICADSHLTATEIGQFITSPLYPNAYPSDTSCQWSISAESASPSRVVVLRVLDFSTQGYQPNCLYDNLTIYDGSLANSSIIQVLCGSLSSTQITSTGPTIILVFHSGFQSNYRGFNLEYTSRESDHCRNVTLSATGAVSYFASPGYPNNYPSGMTCHWSISADLSTRAVVLKLVDFVLEGSPPTCYNDNVTIYDGASSSSSPVQLLCGRVESVQVISTGPYLTVVFQSDATSNFRGFKFEYSSQESDSCRSVSLTATDKVQYITSLGYPNNYPSNVVCQWTIQAIPSSRVVVLNVLDFELEGFPPNCTYDYVAIYDGSYSGSPLLQRLCGQVANIQVISTAYYMNVQFRSDGAINYRGFRLEYTSQEKSEIQT